MTKEERELLVAVANVVRRRVPKLAPPAVDLDLCYLESLLAAVEEKKETGGSLPPN